MAPPSVESNKDWMDLLREYFGHVLCWPWVMKNPDMENASSRRIHQPPKSPEQVWTALWDYVSRWEAAVWAQCVSSAALSGKPFSSPRSRRQRAEFGAGR